MPGSEAAAWRASIITELGLTTADVGETITGRAPIVDPACVPGSGVLRTSVLATWADILTGLLAGKTITPRIPLTLDLDIQVVAPAPSGTEVVAVAEVVKAGRSIVVCEVEFRDRESNQPIALGQASFMASPNPEHVQTGEFDRTLRAGRVLRVPLAERARLRIIEPGTVEVPRSADGLNGAGGIQGGLVALAIEEAAASWRPEPVLMASLVLRYLKPFAVGPARAVAEPTGDVAIVRVRDVGQAKLGAIATVRLQSLA